MGTSKIEWTDAVWNPVTGCSKVSAGCKNCYAERIFPRIYGNQSIDEGTGPHHRRFIDVVCHPERLEQPLQWRKPRRIFVNSMSDLFHEAVPDEFVDKVFAVMLACAALEGRRHTFQILTKRPERMRCYLTNVQSKPGTDLLRRWAEVGNGWICMDDEDVLFSEYIMGRTCFDWDDDGYNSGDSVYAPWAYTRKLFPLPNVCLGVSVENQETADERIPLLLQTPAVVRFVSYEPAIGPMQLTRHHQWCPEHDFDGGFCSSPCPSLRSIDWLICGGESGPKARPMQEEWARDVMLQCRASRVPFFMKQGSKYNWPDFKNFESFPDDLQVREFPK